MNFNSKKRLVSVSRTRKKIFSDITSFERFVHDSTKMKRNGNVSSLECKLRYFNRKSSSWDFEQFKVVNHHKRLATHTKEIRRVWKKSMLELTNQVEDKILSLVSPIRRSVNSLRSWSPYLGWISFLCFVSLCQQFMVTRMSWKYHKQIHISSYLLFNTMTKRRSTSMSRTSSVLDD